MIAFRSPGPRRRSGATLTEVLMAILVMGIGLFGVMSLFPLAILRSVEATKLTSATLLRINAEALIDAVASVDSAGNMIDRAVIEDPNANGVRGRDDIEEYGNFIFDPLGAAVAAEDGRAPAPGNDQTLPRYNSTFFGDFDGDGNAENDAAQLFVRRFTFGLNSVADAERFVTLPDSFTTLADLPAASFTYDTTAPGSITIGDNSLAEYAGQPVRVTALHVDEPASVVRNGTVASAGNGVMLSGVLPGNYDASSIGRVLIELPERRYTWMATVRRLDPRSAPSVTIVAFFRRAFGPNEERVWTCEEPAGSYNEFTWRPSQNGDAEPPPGMKKGGWMFDLYTFRWWKISGVQKAGSGTATVYRISTDPEEEDPSDEPRLVSLSSPVYAVFPDNVVEAYTLKKD